MFVKHIDEDSHLRFIDDELTLVTGVIEGDFAFFRVFYTPGGRPPARPARVHTPRVAPKRRA